VANAMNWYLTSCYLELFKKNATARFIVFGAGCYLLSGLVDLVLAAPSVDRLTGLTLAGMAAKNLAIHGFIGSVLLGAIYYILPRVMQSSWPNDGWIGVHYWMQASGVILIVIGLLLGGLVQGSKMADAAIPFVTISKSTAPFVGLSTMGVLLLLAGQAMLALNLLKLVRAHVEPIARSAYSEACGCGPAVKAGVKP